MSDRKLLEAAAKAAGYVPQWLDDETLFVFGVQDEWNPLKNDGDAFRLAVQLGLSIELHTDQSQPLPWLRVTDINGNWTHSGPGGEFAHDPTAATRKAIVIAASKCA